MSPRSGGGFVSRRLESAVGAFKLGLNPGPFFYSFEKSDPSALFKYAMFVMVANDSDWEALINLMAPIRSADKIVENLREEIHSTLKYPAMGWLAGVGVGFALPLNTPITLAVTGYNAVGAALAYSKGIADLDNEISKAMPKLHGALSKQIDTVVANYFAKLAEDYRTFVKNEPPDL